MLYLVHVKPGSKRGPLVLTDPANATELTVYLREKPVDGAANQALIQVLAEHFRVAKTQIIIRRGHASRHKQVEVLHFCRGCS